MSVPATPLTLTSQDFHFPTRHIRYFQSSSSIHSHLSSSSSSFFSHPVWRHSLLPVQKKWMSMWVERRNQGRKWQQFTNDTARHSGRTYCVVFPSLLSLHFVKLTIIMYDLWAFGLRLPLWNLTNVFRFSQTALTRLLTSAVQRATVL